MTNPTTNLTIAHTPTTIALYMSIVHTLPDGYYTDVNTLSLMSERLEIEYVTHGTLANLDPFNERNWESDDSVHTDMANLGQIMVEDEMVAECERLAHVLGGPVGDIDADEILADTKHVFRWDVQRAINVLTWSADYTLSHQRDYF